MIDIRCLLGFHKWVRKPVDVSKTIVMDDNYLGGYDEWLNEAEIDFEARVCPRCHTLNGEDHEKIIALLIEAKKIRKP